MKERGKLRELDLMKCLHGRIVFSEQEERQYRFWLAGDAGECGLNERAEVLDGFVVRINDLLIVQDRTCQIDMLFIGSRKVYVLDAKHWEGNYTLGPNGFVGLTHDPLHQLQRAQRMIAEILRRMRVSLSVEARLVFTNPGVTLYGLTPEMPIVLPHQIDGYFSQIRLAEGPLSDWQVRLAERLLQFHSEDNPYRKLMAYDRSTVRPGILCGECRGVMQEYDRWKIQCADCRMIEPKSIGFKRSREEFELLFPGEKKSVDNLYHWTNKIISKRSIYSLLRK